MFNVRNAMGERICAPEHFDEALEMLRLLPDAAAVVRDSDGALLAIKQTPKPRKAEFRLTTHAWGAA